VDVSLSSSLFQIVEDEPGAAVNLEVKLSASFEKIVTFNYSTADSTAVAGKDYVSVTTGKLTFQPGETSRTIVINILADSAQKKDVYFKVVFSNPVNAVLKRPIITIKVINVDYSTLSWSDEFTTGSLNTNFWNYESGNNNGWGNNEKEDYTSSISNVHIDSGFLHITAINPSLNYYTSGRITTKGKKEFTYGKVVIRARLPEGKGIWPAIWMLGGNISTESWPKCGEIDIMELLGHEPVKVYGTVHWDENGHTSKGGNMTLSTGSFSFDFHLFCFIWTPNHFIWLVDNVPYLSIDRSLVSKFPFDLPEFFIFNVAVGGTWPGNPDGTTVFPQHMIVDYIRVYQ
jgi:beta-glucanase (GH16 family)